MDLTKDSKRDCSLILSLNGVDWDDKSEGVRRFRAKVVASHAKDNCELRRSEFAWDADAWRDVFGNLRDDDLIAMDKRRFYGVEDGFNPDLPTNKGSFNWRIPDMTFGLKPFEYQNCLRDARLHPNYGLIADPKWDDMSLLFPFMVYEAKALAKPGDWSDAAGEAWKQGYHAARMYLALQESLMRVPGRAEEIDRPLQYPPVERCDPRCFVLTSVGPQWTIYSTYPNEVHEQTFYTWSNMVRYRSHGNWLKIWNGDVQSERSAWELLYQIDKIHQWARTFYRDMIRHYLRSWHNAVKKDILFEWKMGQDGQRYRQPRREDINTEMGVSPLVSDLTMPFWAMAVGKEWRVNLMVDAKKSFREAYNHTEEGRELEKTWRQDRFCTHENADWEHQMLCMPEDKEFLKKWLAGPGRKWQE